MPGKAYRALQILGWVDAGLFLLVGLAELGFADGAFGHRALFTAVLALFAVLVIAGIALVPTRPWPGAVVASIGAVLGAFALFWTGLAIVLAVAILVLCVVSARSVQRSPQLA